MHRLEGKYNLDITPEEFDAFMTNLKLRDKTGAYRLVHVQKLAYRLTKSICKTGKDSEGNKLTEQELEDMRLIMKQIKLNFEVLKEEYEYNEKS